MVIFLSGIYITAFSLMNRLDPMETYYINKSVYMDRPCDNELRKLCSQSGTKDWAGINFFRWISRAGKWELKLQLGPNDRIVPGSLPLLEVYGASDDACGELGYDMVPVDRGRWFWHGLESFWDMWNDFDETATTSI